MSGTFQTREAPIVHLKIGELAKRSGLTVRTLHHYDAIGLLRPAARSGNGYRIYEQADVARLHQIQALKQFGLSLEEIGEFLLQPDLHLPQVVEQQIQTLSRQIEKASNLRNRLLHLHGQLLSGDEPDLAEWLSILRLMRFFDAYFSAEELRQLPFARQDAPHFVEWRNLVSGVRDLMQRGVAPDDKSAMALASRWMLSLETDTRNNPQLLAKLSAMHDHMPASQTGTGCTPEMLSYVHRSFLQTRLPFYARYLTAEELRLIEDNYVKCMHRWPPLIAEARRLMAENSSVDAPQTRDLAQRWQALSCAGAGGRRETQQKIRQAQRMHPELLRGTWCDAELLAFIDAAIAHADPQDRLMNNPG